jgi:hypothetical protein
VLGYLGLALGISALVRRRGDTAPLPRSAWVVPPMVLLLVLGLMGQADVRARLRETGGVGLMSDAINRFSADARSGHAKDFHYFPDWGLALPFAFLTGGDIDHVQAADATEARALLCQGRDVRLALIGPERGRRLAEWTRALDWPDPVVDAYRQRDGVVVIEVATYRAGLPGSSGERCRPR